MNNKNRQERKTRTDCLQSQKEMRQIVLEKIKKNETLTIDETDKWMKIIADALITWGKNVKAYIELPTIRIPLGSVHTFALRFMDWGNPVEIKYMGQKYKFQIKELWKLLYKYMIEIFPYALDEALHISKESEKREEGGSYEYSYKKSLESPTSY